MKKILGFSTALVLCVTLAASAAQAGKSKQNVVNINFATYVWQPTTVKAMNAIVDSWNKTHAGIQVHIVPVDVNSVHDKLLTSFVGGTAADIIHDEAADIAGFTAAGLPREPDAADPEGPQGRDPAVGVGHGQLRPRPVTGVPIMLQTYNVFANMTSLKAAGIKAPTVTNPWTWDAVPRGVEEAVDERQLRRLLGPPLADRDDPDALAQLGRPVELPREGKWVLKVGSGEQTTLTTMHDMIYSDKSIDPAGVGLSGSAVLPGVLRRQVRDDRAGQLPGAGHDRAEPEGLQLGDVPAAQGQDAEPGREPADASISPQSQHKAEAMQFIAYALNAQNMAKLAAGDWLIPAAPRRRRSSSSRRSTTAAGRTPSRRCRTSRRRTGSR